LSTKVVELDGYDEMDDFFAPVVGFAHEMVETGRYDEDRPEDRLARKLSRKGIHGLTQKEMDVLEERLSPLASLYYLENRDLFEAEFLRRRALGFYDKPAFYDGLGELF
jgi:hypothetical protein